MEDNQSESIGAQVYQQITTIGSSIGLPDALQQVEHFCVSAALLRSHGSKAQAARILKIKRTTLIEKARRLGIPLCKPTRRSALSQDALHPQTLEHTDLEMASSTTNTGATSTT